MDHRLEYIDLSGPTPECQTCLSVDRRLRLMGRYDEIFRRIVGPNFNSGAVSGFDTSQLRICWECASMLRNIVLFHDKVYAANRVLGQSLQRPLTNLAVDVLKPISYSIQENDIEPMESSPIQIKEDSELQEVTEAVDDDGYNFTDDPFDIEVEVEVKPPVIKQETEHIEHDELPTIKTEEPDIPETKPKSSKKGFIKREKIKIKSEKKIKHKKPVKLTGIEKKYVHTRFKTLHRIGLVQRVKLNSQDEEENMFNKVSFSPTEIEERMQKERESEYFRTRKRRCHKCVLAFDRGQNLNYHMRAHKADKHTCSVCKIAFPEKTLLEDHIKEHYYKFVCTSCGFSCLARNHIVWHYKRRHEYGYQCRKCEIIIADKEQFLAHHKQWHTVYICDYCGKKCSMRHKIAAHIRTHSKYLCGVCGASYKRAESLRAHTLLRHSSDGSGAYCVECDRHFEHQFAYKDHLMRLARHQPKREKSMIPCPDCDKVFSKTTYMREHRNLVHLHIYNFHCDQCDKNFLRRSALNRHTWKNHEHRPLAKNKICQFCGRGFTCNKILNNHIRTHTGERPFECDRCSATFAQRTALTTHLKKHKYTHDGAYACCFIEAL